MKPLHPHQKKLLWDITIVSLIVICAISIVWFVNNTRQLYQSGDLQTRCQMRNEQQHAVTIQSWMTFNYINVVFKLPSGYLQNALNITDQHYPNIRIDTYAKQHSLNADTFLQTIRQTINSYPAIN